MTIFVILVNFQIFICLFIIKLKNSLKIKLYELI